MNYLNLKKYGAATKIIQEAEVFPDYSLARVIRQNRNLYDVVSENGEARASVSGKLCYLAEEGNNFPSDYN